MNDLVLYVLCGFLGGLVRCSVGVIKSAKSRKGFSSPYAIVTLLGSGVIGAFVALTLFSDYKMALLAGYCGMDILENAMKLLVPQAPAHRSSQDASVSEKA